MKATTDAKGEGLARASEASRPSGGQQGGGGLRRHRKLFLWLMVGWALITGLLVWLSSGPQNEPFVYQVF